MGEPLIFAPVDASLDKKPWERWENEPARWHMRFKRYLAMGYRRSINAVYETERAEKQGKASSKVSAGWYEAARRYQWEARAAAWDDAQSEEKAVLMRQIAARSPFVSRPYRIVQLNTLCEALTRAIDAGQDVAVFVTMVKQMRELMGDMKAELDEWNVPLDASCDAAALDALKQDNKRRRELNEERQADEEAALDRKIAECVARGLL